MVNIARVPNFFEKIILLVGVFMLVFGYIVIKKQIELSGLGFEAVQTIFLWLIVIILVIILAANENMKEELIFSSNQQLEQTKLLTESVRQDLKYEDRELTLLKEFIQNDIKKKPKKKT